KIYNNASLKTHKKTMGFDESLGLIIRLYHSLEKGLANEKFKKESSLKNVSLLLTIFLENNKIDYSDVHVQAAIKTVSLYFEKHPNKGTLEFEIQRRKFKQILEKVGDVSGYIGGVKQIPTKPKNQEIDYKEFVKTRVSVRSFSGKKIILEDILKVIDIARYCPSACNRQAVKLFYSLNSKENEHILKLQNGSRSFREAVPGLIVITSDLRYQEGSEERNLGFIEGGIWISSLVNSLHAYNIGSCVLNWCVNPETDKKLRDLINIPYNYQIISLLAIGYANNDQLVPFSVRKEAIDFIQNINLK
ncbi:nitroreductase family protein, partial [Escherichia coli]